jgi:NAD(P)H-nitrite reductase large subunit
MNRYVIVGSGVAGIAAAEAIADRSDDLRNPILVLSDDPFGYYSRPGLAYYLSGELDQRALFPKDRANLAAMNVEIRQARVVALDPLERYLTLADGKRVDYDRLLLATGSLAAPIKVRGAEAATTVKLDNLTDARDILDRARRARSAVVVGGGITALEIAEGLHARGLEVHYLLRGERYWGNVLDETESRMVERELQHKGIHIHYHTELEEIVHQNGRVRAVVTKDGETIRCDMVAAAIGVRPRVDLAAAANLQMDRGVLVSPYLESSAPGIFVAGDAAQVFDPLTGKANLDTLWSIARDQGTTAGLNMAGGRVEYRKPVPFNVTRLGDMTTTIIGSVGGGEASGQASIMRGESETWSHTLETITVDNQQSNSRLRVLVGPDRLVGAVVMGDQTLSRPLEALITSGADITRIRSHLLASDDLIRSVFDFWTEWKTQNAQTQP